MEGRASEFVQKKDSTCQGKKNPCLSAEPEFSYIDMITARDRASTKAVKLMEGRAAELSQAECCSYQRCGEKRFQIPDGQQQKQRQVTFAPEDNNTIYIVDNDKEHRIGLI